ncbi:hypothetical protein C8R44DRAFT_864789 [Mycena epipterygia]|nr:hypothetical protein C8R44DRAFT_864789 [Mycena epipterygia]
MRNPSRFLALPNELIHKIAGCTESRDLLTLCQVNRQIHDICLEWIYRSITVAGPAQVVKCCRTLISCAQTADLVRTFKISCYPRRALKSYYATVGSAIRKLKNVQSLEVPPSLPLFRLFSSTQFPQLSECILPSSVDIIPFVQRHTMISILHVLPSLETPWDSSDVPFDRDAPFEFMITSPIPPAHLPKLRAFIGPAALAYSVVPGSSTEYMSIDWEINGMSPSAGVATLARSNADVVWLQNIVLSWDCQLLSAVADHMPRLRYLLFRNINDFHEKELFFSCMDDTLRSLLHLEAIVLSEGLTDPHDEDVREEFEVVRRWGEISSILKHVTFPSNTQWRYMSVPFGGGGGLWLPGIDALQFKMEDFDLKSFYIAVLTSSVTLPSNYYSFAQYLAGSDALLTVVEAIHSGRAIPAFVPTHNLVQPFRLESDDDA